MLCIDQRSKAKVGILNTLRIIMFALVLLVLRVLCNLVTDGSPAIDKPSTEILFKYLTGYLLDGLVVVVVIGQLARVQVRLLYVHVIIVVILQELVGAVLLHVTGWVNPPSPLWIIDWLVLAVSVLLGAEIGRRLRAQKGDEDII